MKHKFLIYAFFLFNSANALANSDSLYSVWKDVNQHDTVRFKAMHNFIWQTYLFVNPDTARVFAEEQLDYAILKKNSLYIADAYNTKGITYYFTSELDSAITYFQLNLDVLGRAANIKSMASGFLNLGAVYFAKGEYDLAVEKYTLSMRIEETKNNKPGVARCLLNIGNIHLMQNELELAWDYFSRAAAIYEEMETPDRANLAALYSNMGVVASQRGDFVQAEKYHSKSLELEKQGNNKQSLIASLTNVGLFYVEQGLYDTALPYFLEANNMLDEFSGSQAEATIKNNIAGVYLHQNKINEAIALSELSLKLAQEIGALVDIRDASETLYMAYLKKSDYRKSLDMYMLYTASKDSIASEENLSEVLRQEYKFTYETKAMQDSLLKLEEKKLDMAELEAEKAKSDKRKQQSLFLLVGLVFAIVFGIFIYSRLRLTNKQKTIIQSQKIQVVEAYEKLEEKNKEVLDSITYAKRIQSAILPSEELINECLSNAFIIYAPKDIVAGDFYWLEPVYREGKEPLILFAAADCTGHGVPGALVSVVCHNALNRAVREFGLTDPGKILDQTREIVIAEFQKGTKKTGNSSSNIKDGMDIALCAIDGDSISYAGANNPLWIVRNNELISFKPDKQPIGNFDQRTPFNTHQFSLLKNDTVYIFTDGYVDQFGGEKGKKFKASNLKELLLSMAGAPMDQQETRIREAFEKWRGNLEQIDDVCLIGVRV
jgi:serine phosphatase RsbU (regulator of sigma subunit)/Flp pilus assembly protein TadD